MHAFIFFQKHAMEDSDWLKNATLIERLHVKF